MVEMTNYKSLFHKTDPGSVDLIQDLILDL